MEKIIGKSLILLMVLAIFSVARPVFGADPGNAIYMTYVNARYQFELLYPKDMLKPNPPPDNNDGRSFDSPDKKIHMVAAGGYNVLDRTWKEEFQAALDSFSGDKITYKTIKNNSFVISGFRKDKVFYYKELKVIEDGSEVFLVFEIEYPKTDKVKWDAIAAKCANSFKMSEINIPTDTNAMGLGTNADRFK